MRVKSYLQLGFTGRNYSLLPRRAGILVWLPSATKGGRPATHDRPVTGFSCPRERPDQFLNVCIANLGSFIVLLASNGPCELSYSRYLGGPECGYRPTLVIP